MSDISNALRLITAPALIPTDGPVINLGDKGDGKGDWGVVNLLTQEEEENEEGRKNSQQRPSVADRDGLLNTKKQSGSSSDHKSSSSRGTATLTLLDSLRSLALFSGGDFRACVQTLLLSVPLYQDTEAMRRMQPKVPSVSHGSWNDTNSLQVVGSYITWGATRQSLLYPAFDRQGDRLARLLDVPDVTYAPHSTLCGVEVLVSTDSNVLSPSSDGGLAVKSGVNHTGSHTLADRNGNNYPTLSGLVVPVVMSLSPTQCLVAGGELITISGKHFLQRKLSQRGLKQPEIGTGMGTGILGSEDPAPQGDSATPVSDPLEGSAKGEEEGEAQRMLERAIVRVEVLVNEVPVPIDRVFLISNTEISFIFPSTTAGVATVVVRMVDQLDQLSAPLDLQDDSAHNGTDSSCTSDAVRATVGGLSTVWGSVHITAGAHSSYSELHTLPISPCPPHSREVVVRSDICGSAGGGVMVRDRRMRDIRLFFAPRRALSSRDKELDKERNKDKNISFFMTEGFGAGGKKDKDRDKERDRDSKWDEVEEDIWDDDMPSSFDKSKPKQSKSKREREEEEHGFSSDSDAFIDAPPRSSTHRTQQKTSTESLSQSRSKEGKKEIISKNVPTLKRLRNNRPALDLVTHTAVNSTLRGGEVIESGNVCDVDIDNDADFFEDDSLLPVTAVVSNVTDLAKLRQNHGVPDTDSRFVFCSLSRLVTRDSTPGSPMPAGTETSTARMEISS